MTYENVYILYHGYDDDAENEKMIGVYSTEELAQAAQERAKLLQGFRDHPHGFLIAKCWVNRDEWAEGFGIE